MRITAVGDIMLGEHPSRRGIGISRNLNQSKLKFQKNSLSKIFNSPDIFLGNLECVMSNEQTKNLPFTFDYRYLDILKQGKYNIFSLANNHTMEYGPRNFKLTSKRMLINKCFPLGIKDKDRGSTPINLNVRNNKIVFLSFSLRPEETQHKSLYANHNELNLVKKLISNVSHENFVILSIHWGDEFVETPSKEQISLGREFIDLGVNVILGHHTHTLLPVEIYKGGIIAYSLGNFISDMNYPQTLETISLNLKVNQNKLESFSATPLKIVNDFPKPDKNKESISDIFVSSEYIDKKLFEIVEQYGSYKKYVETRRKSYRSFLKFDVLKNSHHYSKKTLFLFLMSFVKKWLILDIRKFFVWKIGIVDKDINNIKEEFFKREFDRINIYKKFRVLDIGCADIRSYSLDLIENCGIYIGIDNSKDFVEQARQNTLKYNNCIISHANAEKINVSDKTFDLVVFNDMLAYVDKGKVMSEVYRVLKEGGYAISFFNNTIDYYIYKILNKSDNHLNEIIHSLFVIFNTILFQITNKKLHRTTYLNLNKSKELIYNNNFKNINFLKIRDKMKYKTLNFIANKRNL